MTFPTPTNGINSALAVNLSGTNLIQLGTQVVNSKTSQNTAPSGTQFNAWFSGSFPGGADYAALPGAGTGAAGATDGTQQYGLTLSLSGKTVNGVVLASTCQLTTTILDTQDNTVAQGSLNPVFVSYADPTSTTNVGSGGNANWKPSTASTGFPLPTNFNGQCASVSSTGLITAISVGQALIEVQYPFASNTLANMGAAGFGGSLAGGDSQDPVARQEIYAQVLVQVIP